MKYIIYSLALLLFTACNNAPHTAPKTNEADTSQAAVAFFPVADFIKSQVHMVDSMKLPLTKTTTVGKKITTDALTQEVFTEVAMREFCNPDINSPALKPQYKENAFADQSIPSVNLTYNTKNPALEIQRVDVVIKPDPVQNDKVRSIYIEKMFDKGDTSISKKLYWKADHNCQVITTKQVKNGAAITVIEKFMWDGGE